MTYPGSPTAGVSVSYCCTHGVPFGTYCWSCQNSTSITWWPPQQGWQCPGCHKVWAPGTLSCANCPPKAEVHVDWVITPDEWESLRSLLRQHPEDPFVAALEAEGKLGDGKPPGEPRPEL